MPWILPIIHPANIFRGQWAEEPAQVAYLKRAKEFLGGWRPPDVEENPPDSTDWPTLADLETFGQHIECGPWNAVAVDIENAGHFITLIGLTLMDLEGTAVGPSLSLPFRVRHGHRYWPTWAAHRAAVGHLYDWLANPYLAKVFHNGVTHDVPILEDTGFEVRGALWDTMILCHHAYPEMRKALQYCATLYCGIPNWKALLSADDQDEGKD